jgi:hypothetical protein
MNWYIRVPLQIGIYRTSHSILRWLPTKLAEWIGENLQEALDFPDKGVVSGAHHQRNHQLYVAPVDHMVGRVPLIPLFLAGNSTPTVPHKFSKHKASGFPMGCAD